MARADDVIENPVTGERILFRQTAAEGNGELLQIEISAKPGGIGPPYHIHPHQEERFEVLVGKARFRVAGKEQSCGAGEKAAVPPGVPHTFVNEGDEELRMVVELRPPEKMETFFETLFGLAREGKINKKGNPSPLQALLIAREYDVVLAGPPVFLQKAAAAVLSPVARLFGYRARYEKYSGPE